MIRYRSILLGGLRVLEDVKEDRDRILQACRKLGVSDPVFFGDPQSYADEFINNINSLCGIIDIELIESDRDGLYALDVLNARSSEIGAFGCHVVYSNHGSPSYRNQSIKLGAAGFVEKTKDIEKDIEKIEEIMKENLIDILKREVGDSEPENENDRALRAFRADKEWMEENSEKYIAISKGDVIDLDYDIDCLRQRALEVDDDVLIAYSDGDFDEVFLPFSVEIEE